MIVDTPRAMEVLAAEMARNTQAGSVIALQGNLGAGKTTFARGFLQALGHRGAVKSPTYTLVESYTLPTITVHHFDLYRLKSPEELEQMGFADYLNAQSVVLIEWPEIARAFLPKNTLYISIRSLGQDQREVIVL